MYARPDFTLKGLHFAHTWCICVFHLVLKINNNDFPKQY